MGNALGINLVDHPELATTPEGATRTALQFWQDNISPDAHEDVRRATHKWAEHGLDQERTYKREGRGMK